VALRQFGGTVAFFIYPKLAGAAPFFMYPTKSAHARLRKWRAKEKLAEFAQIGAGLRKGNASLF
jgi:hypothetical protein